MEKLTVHLSPLISPSAASRLKRDPQFASESRESALDTIKQLLYLSKNEKEADEFYKTLGDYYSTAVVPYVKGSLDEEDFQRKRLAASKKVQSLVARYKGQLQSDSSTKLLLGDAASDGIRVLVRSLFSRLFYAHDVDWHSIIAMYCKDKPKCPVWLSLGSASRQAQARSIKILRLQPVTNNWNGDIVYVDRRKDHSDTTKFAYKDSQVYDRLLAKLLSPSKRIQPCALSNDDRTAVFLPTDVPLPP